MFEREIKGDSQEDSHHWRLRAHASKICYVICYLAHSPLGLFSGRLHQVLR